MWAYIAIAWLSIIVVILYVRINSVHQEYREFRANQFKWLNEAVEKEKYGRYQLEGKYGKLMDYLNLEEVDQESPVIKKRISGRKSAGGGSGALLS